MDLGGGSSSEHRETCKPHHRLHSKLKDYHGSGRPGLAVDLVCGVIKRLLCTGHWVWLFPDCLMPGPKASPQAACPAWRTVRLLSQTLIPTQVWGYRQDPAGGLPWHSSVRNLLAFCELLDARLAPVQPLPGWSLKKQSIAPRLSTLSPLHHQSFLPGSNVSNTGLALI